MQKLGMLKYMFNSCEICLGVFLSNEINDGVQNWNNNVWTVLSL